MSQSDSSGETRASAAGVFATTHGSVATHQEMMTLPDFGEDIGALVFSPDGRALAVGCLGGTDGRKPVQLWSAPTLGEIDGRAGRSRPAEAPARERPQRSH